MKKIAILCTALLIAASFCTPAFADVVDQSVVGPVTVTVSGDSNVGQITGTNVEKTPGVNGASAGTVTLGIDGSSNNPVFVTGASVYNGTGGNNNATAGTVTASIIGSNNGNAAVTPAIPVSVTGAAISSSGGSNQATAGNVVGMISGNNNTMNAAGAQIAGSLDSNHAIANNVYALDGYSLHYGYHQDPTTISNTPSVANNNSVNAIGAQVVNAGTNNWATMPAADKNGNNITVFATNEGDGTALGNKVTAIGAQVSGSYGAGGSWIGDQSMTYGNVATTNLSVAATNNVNAKYGNNVSATGASILNSGADNHATTTGYGTFIGATDEGMGYTLQYVQDKDGNWVQATNTVSAAGAMVYASHNSNYATSQDVSAYGNGTGQFGTQVIAQGAVVQNSLDINNAYAGGSVKATSYGSGSNYVLAQGAVVADSVSDNHATINGLTNAWSSGANNNVSVIGSQVYNAGSSNWATANGAVSASVSGNNNHISVVGAQVANTK